MWNDEIDPICDKLITNYSGTFPSDKLPKIFYTSNFGNKCCIVNNKTIKQGGEHWLALKDGYMYDSFSRQSEKLNDDFPVKWKETHPRVEQGLFETNCGARCISWLICCELYGTDATAAVI